MKGFEMLMRLYVKLIPTLAEAKVFTFIHICMRVNSEFIGDFAPAFLFQDPFISISTKSFVQMPKFF